MRSSMVPLATTLYTSTSRFCPMRWARSVAWCGGGGVPPRVGVHHHRGARKVQARAAGLQRYEEDRRLVVVELAHETHALALGRGARYSEMAMPRRSNSAATTSR